MSSTKIMLINELRVCAQKILENTELETKAFLLNTSSEIITAYIFFDENEELKFTEVILRISHALIESRLEDEEESFLIPDVREIIDQIAEYILQVSNSIEKEQRYYHVLQNIISAIYPLTDHGIYDRIKKL